MSRAGKPFYHSCVAWPGDVELLEYLKSESVDIDYETLRGLVDHADLQSALRDMGYTKNSKPRVQDDPEISFQIDPRTDIPFIVQSRIEYVFATDKDISDLGRLVSEQGQRREDVLSAHERGPWLATSLGGAWSILEPRPEDAFIEDLIAGLGRCCRYNGQLHVETDFYSVAEHSCLMAIWAIKTGVVDNLRDAIAVLMHDGSEAYLGDMASPLKALMPEFKKYEALSDYAVQQAFDIVPGTGIISKATIKSIDTRICLDERDAIIASPAKELGVWQIFAAHPGLQGLDIKIGKLSAPDAMGFMAATFDAICEIYKNDVANDHPIMLQRERLLRSPMMKFVTQDVTNQIELEKTDEGMELAS